MLVVRVETAFALRGQLFLLGSYSSHNAPNPEEFELLLEGRPARLLTVNILPDTDADGSPLGGQWTFAIRANGAGSQYELGVKGEKSSGDTAGIVDLRGCAILRRHWASLAPSQLGAANQPPLGLISALQAGDGHPPPSTALAVHLDNVQRTAPGALIVSGWVSLPHGPLPSHLIVGGSSHARAIPWTELITHFRSDVVEFMDKKGASVRTALNFQAIVNLPGEANPIQAAVILEDGAAAQSQSTDTSIADPMDVAATLFDTRTENSGPIVRSIARLVDQRYAAQLAHKPVQRDIVFHPGSEPPVLSFIIPIYRRWDFIRYHTLMFRRLAQVLPTFEVIYVVDDPYIEGQIRAWARSALPPLNHALRIVALESNFGFARASNVGLSIARGANAIYMNSDIYIRHAIVVNSALRFLHSHVEVGIIGFTLLYEDETIQHDGISFEPVPYFFDFEMPDHPRRGHLWRNGSKPAEFLPCDLLTGAFMLGRTERFREVGGFPEDYVIGDFEDIEFCLNMRRRYRNFLCRGTGIYHLERQSMSLVDRPSRRMAILTRNRHLYAQRVEGRA